MEKLIQLWPGFAVNPKAIQAIRLLPPIQNFQQRIVVSAGNVTEILEPATQEDYDRILSLV